MKVIIIISLILISLLLFGTLMYHRLEGWPWITSLYFSTVTLTTIGYGDVYPTSDASRLFTIFYIMVGVGTMLYGLETILEHIVEKRITSRLPRTLRGVRIRRGPRWKFGGRSETGFKIKMLFKNLGEKIEKFRNKHRVNH